MSKFHSSHYESNKIEPITYIMANNMSFNRGNIVKYAHRAGKKEGQQELDIKKIIDYAMLLGFENGAFPSREELIMLIDYRYDWKEEGER